MNWLAHLQLSPPEPAWRIGNLLPDLLSAPELRAMPALFAAGIAQHRAIDRFTDAHPVFRQSCSRIGGPLRRYGPILVDIFYDHFLSLEWTVYAGIPLEVQVAEFHASIDEFRDSLPPPAYERLCRIRDAGLLLSYGSIGGVHAALERVGRRLRRPVNLEAGVELLRAESAAFAADFARFYPELVRAVARDDGSDKGLLGN